MTFRNKKEEKVMNSMLMVSVSVLFFLRLGRIYLLRKISLIFYCLKNSWTRMEGKSWFRVNPIKIALFSILLPRYERFEKEGGEKKCLYKMAQNCNRIVTKINYF